MSTVLVVPIEGLRQPLRAADIDSELGAEWPERRVITAEGGDLAITPVVEMERSTHILVNPGMLIIEGDVVEISSALNAVSRRLDRLNQGMLVTDEDLTRQRSLPGAFDPSTLFDWSLWDECELGT